MKYPHMVLPLIAALLVTGNAAAQSEDAQRAAEIAAREAEFAERMREAEERLAEAARRVAELSSERLGAVGDVRRFAFDFSSRPRIGVTIGDGSPNTPVEGVSVIGVTPGSAAADAGLRAGDMLTAINGESMSAANARAANEKLLDFMTGVEEGDKLDIEYLRDGKVGRVELEPRVADSNVFAWVGPREQGMPTAPRAPGVHVAPNVVERFRYAFGGWHGAWADMELVELNEGLGRYFGTDKGLLVISAPKSDTLKLQDGDVIESIDGREPTSVNHCMRILGSYQPGEKLELGIMRDRRRQKIEIEMPDDRSSRFAPLQAPLPAPLLAPHPETAPSPAAAPLAIPLPERSSIEST